MEMKRYGKLTGGFGEKNADRIIAAVLILLLGIWMALRYDFYYDLNDDVLIKDILSGVYTGAPESRNIQMLYPLSLLISLVYRLLPEAPVYGIFLCVCGFGCTYLIMVRSLGFCRRIAVKLLLAALEGLIITVLYLEHFVFIQYTVTCALLAGTAAFLFLTTESGLSVRAFMKQNLPAVALVLTAFCLRSEMLLLTLPLICVAGVMKWSGEDKIFTKENAAKYLTVFGCILAGLAVCYGIHAAAYGSKEWKTFTEYFNSRTELYDFQGIPPYEGNEDLYERLGFTKEEQDMLFIRYNFGMDDTLDAGLLDAMAVWQAEHKADDASFTENLLESLKNYVYRTFHKGSEALGTAGDYPWNIMVILSYICVFIAGVWGGLRQGKSVSSGILGAGWKLLVLGGVRTALWMFILMRGRDPERITHSLYLMELCILWAVLFEEGKETETKANGQIKAAVVFPVIIAITSAVSLFPAITSADRSYGAREEGNVVYQGMMDYCRSHGDRFYFIDVFSSVSHPDTSVPYSEKLFRDVDNSPGNYDIMGGWFNKSPLYEKKMSAFGITSMQEAIAQQDNVYVMAELAMGTDFLSDYYNVQDRKVRVELVDQICGIIGVYKVRTEDADGTG